MQSDGSRSHPAGVRLLPTGTGFPLENTVQTIVTASCTTGVLPSGALGDDRSRQILAFGSHAYSKTRGKNESIMEWKRM